MTLPPLAERLRPESLDQVIGQQHLVGAGQLLSELVSRKQPTNLILWGPPGSGKTTLARIIASELGADFIELSAVTAGVADVRGVIKRAEQNQRMTTATILFVDEIHRFNKAQQDAFLPHVESGLISLIGATTENPSFEIINPLLSRSRVIVLEPISHTDMILILKRAAKKEGVTKRLKPAVYNLIAELSGGDARVALNILELALSVTDQPLTEETVYTAAQRRLPGYDKGGETHYNVISAFIKSLRGSNAHAALYYMARMLQSGEDPKFIARRMVVFASEDIGLAANGALGLAINTFAAVERVGMPECEYSLYHCAIVLAGAKKSRLITDAMGKAKQAAQTYPDAAVPLHLRNAPTKLMKELGYGKNYKWQAGFGPKEGFLPSELSDFTVY